jgi:hypothetical protein
MNSSMSAITIRIFRQVGGAIFFAARKVRARWKLIKAESKAKVVLSTI